MALQLETLRQHPSSGLARAIRVTVPGIGATTAHVATYPRAGTRLRIRSLEPPRPLQQWCEEGDVPEALNGGFFTKPEWDPLGQLWLEGRRHRGRDFTAPWDERRGAIHVTPDGAVAIGPRDTFATEPSGELLQAGPLLVVGGAAMTDDVDPEGIASTCEEFDSDISSEPLPRSAIGLSAHHIFAVAVDGRHAKDRGLLLSELGELLVQLGATDALNLDGGSSASLVTAGERRNNPRDDAGAVLEEGYPTPSAFVFEVDGAQ